MNNRVIIFSAPSGAGKTTLVKAILQNFPEFNLEFSISACTRAKRENEVHGKDYYFISVDEFKQLITDDKLVEWQEVYTNSFYGTPQSEMERIAGNGNYVLFDVDVVGGVNLKKIFGANACSIFVMPPSIEILEDRLIKRSTDTPESIAKRVAKAKLELEYAPQFDCIVTNDSLEKAVQEAANTISNFLFNADSK